MSDEDRQDLPDKVRKNLEDGVFKFITVWDQREEKLDDVINYINQKINNTTIYVITLKYFKDHGLELYIPDVFGTESEKLSAKKSAGLRKKWNEDSLREKFDEEFSANKLESFETLFEFSKKYGTINYGSGVTRATFSAVFEKFSKTGTMSLFTLRSDGKMELNFEWIKQELREPFAEKLTSELGIQIKQENHYPLRRDEWSSNTEKIVKIIQGFL